MTTAVADGLSTGAKVTIAGASHSALDGTFTITVTSSTTFYYTFSGSAGHRFKLRHHRNAGLAGLHDQPARRPAGPRRQRRRAPSCRGYTYLGLSTIVQENNGNGTALTYITQTPTPTPTPTPSPTPPPTTIDSGGDRYDRPGPLRPGRSSRTGTPPTRRRPRRLQGDQYGYDADSNVLYDNIVGQGSTAAGFSQLYHASSTTSGDNNGAYDPLGRVTHVPPGHAHASGNNTYSSAPLDTITNANINTASDSDETYTLDAAGQLDQLRPPAPAPAPAPRRPSPAPAGPTTARTSCTGDGSATLTFDNNGNTTKDQAGNTYTYDAWDRPIDATLSGGGSIVYGYLPGEQPAPRVPPAPAAPPIPTTPPTCRCWRTPPPAPAAAAVAAAAARPTVESQYVWGLDYVNQMVERDDNSSSGSLGISGSGLGERIYPEQDANFNVRTLTSNSGTRPGAHRLRFLRQRRRC